jgi:hypothetical protein
MDGSDSIGAFLQLHNDKSLYALTNHHIIVGLPKNTVEGYREARKPLVAASRIKLTIPLNANHSQTLQSLVPKVAKKKNEYKPVITTIIRRIYLQGKILLKARATHARMSRQQHSMDELKNLKKQWRDIVNLSGNLRLGEVDYSSGY